MGLSVLKMSLPRELQGEEKGKRGGGHTCCVLATIELVALAWQIVQAMGMVWSRLGIRCWRWRIERHGEGHGSEPARAEQRRLL